MSIPKAHLPEGSISSFALKSHRICHMIESPLKNTRYVYLELQAMFDSLVELYTDAFATQWAHFRKAGEFIAPPGALVEDSQRLMAKLYISHWFLDLYVRVRTSVEKLAPVAQIELFNERFSSSSNEYDVFLCHLNSVIRPTHVVGCYEDTLFIPCFTSDNMDNLTFGIAGFYRAYAKFRSVVLAIKHKRAGWKTGFITTETVGRPVWLFDWHKGNNVFSWFPKNGNYTSEDVMYAHVIGVACTPNLAHQDMDDWQEMPAATMIDASRLGQVRPRRYFGEYEVEWFYVHNEKFVIYPTSPCIDLNTRKRARSDCPESDSDDAVLQEVTIPRVQKTTFVYYSMVMSDIDRDDRLTTLLGLLMDPNAHSV